MILPLYFFLSRIVFRPTITTPKPSTCACVTPVLAFAPVPAPPVPAPVLPAQKTRVQVSRQTQVQARKHRGAGSKSISQVRCQIICPLPSVLCPLSSALCPLPSVLRGCKSKKNNGSHLGARRGGATAARKAEAVAGNDWLRSQNAVELRP